MKNILKYIPGFRTNNKGNIIVASLYYAYCIYSIPSRSFISSIIWFALPFIIFTVGANSKTTKDKLKAQENNPVEFTKTVKTYTPIVFTRKLTGIIVVVIIALLGFGGLSASAQNKKDAQLVIAQKATADAKVKSDAINKAKADKQLADKKIADKKIADAKAIQDKKVADAKAIQDKKDAPAKAYKAWVDAQFSPWDGSHTYLVDLVKENLNDNKSFKHVKTTYSDKGTYLIVKMTYRASNAFGGIILQNVTAKADYTTNQITIISQND